MKYGEPRGTVPLVGCKIHHYDEVDSTNRLADEMARRGAAEGTVVAADYQSSGQGRLERRWLSPAGKGLWFSVILRPPVEPATTVQLTLLAAVATTAAIGKFCGIYPKIKWPNDLLIRGRKLCGILCEMSGGDSVDHVIVGIGINTNMNREDFPDELSTTATSLSLETNRYIDGCGLLSALLDQLDHWYQQWLKQGFLPVHDAWVRWNGTLGEEITVDCGDCRYQGRAERIEPSGALVVREAGTERIFHFGEVSIRFQKTCECK